MVERRRELEAMSVRGGSLVKGSLPPRKQDVLRVRVPKEALPDAGRSTAKRTNSFGFPSLSNVPLLRSLSFDHFRPRWVQEPTQPNLQNAVFENSAKPTRSNTHDSYVPRNSQNGSHAQARKGSRDSVSSRNGFIPSTPTKQAIQRVQRHTASKTKYY